jgi:hypothetical protein
MGVGRERTIRGHFEAFFAGERRIVLGDAPRVRPDGFRLTRPERGGSSGLEMPLGEGSAGSGLEIRLKLVGLLEVRKGEIPNQRPWQKFLGVARLASVVLFKSLLQIEHGSDIISFGK